ncbi:MAG: hypothetical protein HQK84_01150, partial [Nitrospinae bacterium]|nr:hypothetical protein [Nitrospinota bacterium]
LPIARNYFTYLKSAEKKGVKVNFIFGDGRVNLTKETDSKFDLLIIDAFGSGSIPTHLLTIEAFKEYLRVINNDGMLLMHISNKFVNFIPLLISIADTLDIKLVFKSNLVNHHPDSDVTLWAAMTKSAENYTTLTKTLGWSTPRYKKESLMAPWTDTYSNIIQLLF